MQHMLADVLAIRTFLYGGGTQFDTNQAATDLVSWSQGMSELLPPGAASNEYVDMNPDLTGFALPQPRWSEQQDRSRRPGKRAIDQ